MSILHGSKTKKILTAYVVIGAIYTMVKRGKDEDFGVTIKRGAMWPLEMLGK